MRALQDQPWLLERVYRAAGVLLRPLRRWLVPGGAAEALMVRVERLTKGPLFDCRMCGECVLHSTGMTCPMTCPKNMRNGPCGGVRLDGSCEVLPDQPCIWAQAWRRAGRMPLYGHEIARLLPPVDRRLQDRSAWIAELRGLALRTPAGWDA